MSSSPSHFGIATSVSIGEMLSQSESGADSASRAIRLPTGMRPLDDALGGGFARQDLVLLAGRPGIGKTVAAMQWARSCAIAGRATTYLCFEHSPRALLARLFSLELAMSAPPYDHPALDALMRGLQDAVTTGAAFEDLLVDPVARRAYETLRSYGDKLRFFEASGRGTTCDAIEKFVAETPDSPEVLFIDYLQKIPVRDEAPDAEHTVRRVERLKDLAIQHDIAVVAIAAGDRDALRDRRMRMHHLQGALAYEADTILVLNDKAVAVSRTHLAYDAVRAESFRNQVVLSIEKHRAGPAGLDIEFAKDFAHYRFDPDGAFVAENLVDDLLYMD
jgi:replicative DNA helicase